jgi:hypothetical protein
VHVPSASCDPWLLSLSKFALAFGVTKVHGSHLIKQHQNHLQGIPKLPHHYPPKISPEQLEIMRTFISDCDTNERDPPEPIAVCSFILCGKEEGSSIS